MATVDSGSGPGGDYGQDLWFGTFLTPNAADPSRVVELARTTERTGLDLVTFQDHPYQARFLDMWTLLATVAAQTSQVRVAPNVANLPLRPPAVLARAVASLDLLSAGRVELGLGVGAFWDAIVAMGGPRRTPGESVDALIEAIAVIRALWDTSQRSVRLDGTYYSVSGAHTGPAPAHEIEIWLGAYKRRMLTLTGATADGWLPSQGYVGADALPAMNAIIDEAALAAGRQPKEIRRLYNINASESLGAHGAEASVAEWAEQLAELTLTCGISTFLLAVDDLDGIRRFGAEVAPAVRELVAAERGRTTDPGQA